MTKLIRLVEQKKTCSLPWSSSEVNFQNNNISPCCKFKGTLGAISDGFVNVWSNSRSQELRHNILNDNYPLECVSCNGAEGTFSYKNWKNGIFLSSFSFLQDIDIEKVELPRIFHIGISNVCNLACRMCSPESSSKLTDIIKNNSELKKIIRLPNQNNKISIESMRGSFTNAEMLSLAGGEPTLDKDCLTLIKMVQTESKKLKIINISTNMTFINDEMFANLNSFDGDVYFSVSIDGHPPIHEYIRYGCSWETMVKNMVYVNTNYPNIKWAINSTISNLNVGYIGETLYTLQKLVDEHNINFTSIMTSPVLDKKFLHPSVLPRQIKQLYTEKIMNLDHGCTIQNHGRFLSTGLDLMNNGQAEVPLEEFFHYIRAFDRSTRTNFLAVYPEFSDFYNILY